MSWASSSRHPCPPVLPQGILDRSNRRLPQRHERRQGDSRPTRKVHSNRKSASGGQGRKEIPYIHKKLPERSRGAVRNILIQVLPACRRPSAGRGPGGRNLMDLCDLCELCGERFWINGGGRVSGVEGLRAAHPTRPASRPPQAARGPASGTACVAAPPTGAVPPGVGDQFGSQ